MDAIAEKLATNLAQFTARTEQIKLRIEEYEAQAAKDNHRHQIMLEARMTLRALKKKADRLERAAKEKKKSKRRSGQGSPEKKLMKEKRRRRIGRGRVVKCSERASGGRTVRAGGSRRFWQKEELEKEGDKERRQAKEKGKVKVESD